MGRKFTKFLSTIMAVSMLSGLTSCVENVASSSDSLKPEESGYSYFEQYSSNDQIQKIVDKLGADNSLNLRYNPDKNGAAIRLAHNNGKPIEIAFHPSFSGLEEYATDSLDYLFGILGDINDNYKYEVVDFTGIHDHQIVFQAEDTGNYAGTASISSRVADDGVFNIEWGIITIYRDARWDDSKDAELSFRNTITHEIMHVLGFDDVYPSVTDMHVGNTLIHTSSKNANDFAQLHITPNDYDNFLALYAKPSKNIDADLEKYQQMSDAYKQFYYENWLLSEFQKDNPPIESLPAQETFKFSQGAYLNGTKTEDIDFEIDVDGDSYSLKVVDKNGNVLETKEGKISTYSIDLNLAGQVVDISNAVMVIEDFESDYYFTRRYMKETINEGARSSLMIYKSNGKYVVKDMFAMVENEANQLEPAAQMQ